MKKHNEGYALPFVLVVLIVLCIIAVGIMDFSLRNLRSQQNTIQRMEAKYETAGKIEEIVAAMQTPVAQEAKGFVFEGSKSFSGQLSFGITEDVLRVAATHEQAEETEQLWIIVALRSAGGIKNTVTLDSEENQKLTVKNSGTVQYLWYEIVDLETAQLFVSGQYIPSFAMNGGNAP